mgnify:FL=1
MEFFALAISTLTTIITVLGAGVGVWGIVNLLEGYGSENAQARSQGIKQLVAGGGILVIAQTVISQLATLF